MPCIDNIKRYLRANGLQAIEKDVIADIFGKRKGPSYQMGLADSTDDEDFDLKLESCIEKWETLEMSLINSATIRDYSPLFVTIRHYSSLFALFVLFAIRYSRLFAVRYSRLFAIRDYSLFAIRVFQTPSFPSRMRIVLRRERRLKPSSAVFECLTSILICIPNSSFKQLLGKLDNWSLILFGTSSDPLIENTHVRDAVVPKRLVKNSGKTGTCVICLFFGMQHIGVW